MVEAHGSNLGYDVIPLIYWEQRKHNKFTSNDNYMNIISKYTDEYSLEHSKNVFHSNWIDSQAMFDFIIIFTEYAQTKNPKDRTKIEGGKVGSLQIGYKKQEKV